MYKNIGRKIKGLAEIQALIGIIASIITGFVFMGTTNQLIGILIIVGGSLVSWINSFILYGFGELIENTQIIAENSNRYS